jgi:hypothetical protein
MLGEATLRLTAGAERLSALQLECSASDASHLSLSEVTLRSTAGRLGEAMLCLQPERSDTSLYNVSAYSIKEHGPGRRGFPGRLSIWLSTPLDFARGDSVSFHFSRYTVHHSLSTTPLHPRPSRLPSHVSRFPSAYCILPTAYFSPPTSQPLFSIPSTSSSCRRISASRRLGPA